MNFDHDSVKRGPFLRFWSWERGQIWLEQLRHSLLLFRPPGVNQRNPLQPPSLSETVLLGQNSKRCLQLHTGLFFSHETFHVLIKLPSLDLEFILGSNNTPQPPIKARKDIQMPDPCEDMKASWLLGNRWSRYPFPSPSGHLCKNTPNSCCGLSTRTVFPPGCSFGGCVVVVSTHQQHN